MREFVFKIEQQKMNATLRKERLQRCNKTLRFQNNTNLDINAKRSQ